MTQTIPGDNASPDKGRHRNIGEQQHDVYWDDKATEDGCPGGHGRRRNVVWCYRGGRGARVVYSTAASLRSWGDVMDTHVGQRGREQGERYKKVSVISWRMFEGRREVRY